MTDQAPTIIWSFRLKLLTGLAVFVLLVMTLRARAARSDIARRRAAVRGALVQLVMLQQERYASTGRFATTLDSLPGWTPPATVVVVLEADGDQEWRAIATDSALHVPPRSCGVFLGRPATSPHRAVVEPGVPACW